MLQLLFAFIGMNVTGCLLLLLHCVLHKLTLQKLGYRWNYYVLKLTLFFFFVPVGFLVNHIIDTTATGPVFDHVITFQSLLNTASVTSDYLPVIVSSPDAFSANRLNAILIGIWLVGFITACIIQIWNHLMFRNAFYADNELILDEGILQLCDELKCELKITRDVHLIRCGFLTSPATTGILHPTILLPNDFLNMKDLTENDVRYILTHELIHIKQHCRLVRIIYLIVQCLFWWNPAVYLLFRRFVMYNEFQCDDAVTQSLNLDERKRYGCLLIKFSTAKQAPSYVTCFGGETAKKLFMERADLFMYTRKPKNIAVKAVLLALLLVISGLGVETASACSAYHLAGDTIASENSLKVVSVVYNFGNNSAVDAASTSSDGTVRIEITDVPEELLIPSERDDIVSKTYYLIVSNTDLPVSSEEEVQPALIFCIHTYGNGIMEEHFLHDDGSCTTNYYDVIYCTKCNHVDSAIFSYYTFMSVCQHDY
ncbi:MAG: M56 family metallopeptidase [Lachnospiraceae bacterium]|nr:M56 family metallopeptidase [Lachnospiraceae bacterium]